MERNNDSNSNCFGCNGPSASTHVINITPSVTTPVFAMGASSQKCKKGESIVYNAAANNTTGITYSMDATSAAAGNSINFSTGEVTYDALWVGSTVITANAAGCSPKSATHTVSINDTVSIPVFALGISTERCQKGETINYTATSNYADAISYSLDAASLAAGNTIASASAAVTYVAGWTGPSTITATASGCFTTPSSTHSVTSIATVEAPVFAMEVLPHVARVVEMSCIRPHPQGVQE